MKPSSFAPGAAIALVAALVGIVSLNQRRLPLHTLVELTGQPRPTPLAPRPSPASTAGGEISTPLASAPPMEREPEVPCVDLSPDCTAWQRGGECGFDPAYMHAHCAKSCGSCARADFDGARASAAATAAAATAAAAAAAAASVAGGGARCRDKAASCPLWAASGECDVNPGYMKLSCAKSCGSCDWADFSRRCRADPNATLAVPAGAIGELFRAIDAGALSRYKPRVVSRPPQPWAVVFDEFISAEHADEIVSVASSEEGRLFTPSQGTGGLDDDGQLIPTLSSYRTSSTRWCDGGCLNESAVRELRERVADATGVPDANHEYPQLLRYTQSQYYKEHSDYIPAHRDMPCGPRVYTFFVYMSDVEEGGNTSFPQLGLSVEPKKGRAVLWPSVLDAAPRDIDERTMHIANPVLSGIKYSVNFWIHQHDFKANHAIGCTG
ncbi:hypothetical protein KFE25_014267 [Diacronema lutheri]|uniref:Procollagen-proline 4-dioxygenase n=1 Tax=Diacronema lutheri TaxID=2081491 RepID=A0A8J5XB14_DIALT|nr:hypothetical protein KFE25_014267 [Diacronema lutheri]